MNESARMISDDDNVPNWVKSLTYYAYRTKSYKWIMFQGRAKKIPSLALPTINTSFLLAIWETTRCRRYDKYVGKVIGYSYVLYI
jgi:hypothetical protein